MEPISATLLGVAFLFAGIAIGVNINREYCDSSVFGAWAGVLLFAGALIHGCVVAGMMK